MPSAAIGRPISSPVDIASTAQTREGHEPVGVEEPDCRRGGAGSRTSPDGSRRPALVAIHGYARYASASSPAARSEPRWRRPSQKTGSAPSDTTRDLRERERERRRPDDPERREQHEERIDVRRRAERSARRSRRPSISSGRPCVVLQTACTMFPRSKRPSRKFDVGVAHDREEHDRPHEHRLPRPRAPTRGRGSQSTTAPLASVSSSDGSRRELTRRPSETRARRPRRRRFTHAGSWRIRAERTRRAPPDPARRRTVAGSTRRPYRPRSTQRVRRPARCRGTAAPRGASRACSSR